MKNVLVVDDEVEIVNSLKEYLSDKGFNVTGCNAAEEAYTLYNQSQPDLVLSDIKMPGKSGLDLFRQCQTQTSEAKKIPFVLMTSYSDIIGVENAFSMGVSELIAKPFDLDSLSLVLNYLLNLEESVGAQDKYYPIVIEDFMNSKQNTFDIYLKVGPRFVLVTKSGQEFSEQRIQNFAAKGVKYIYLNSKSFTDYTDMQFAIVQNMSKRPIDMVRKTKVMNHLMTSVGRSFMNQAIDKDIFSNALSSFEAYSQVSLDNSQLNTVFTQLLKSSPDLVEKSATRAMLSSMVASHWKWRSAKLQSRIVISALLCDIGLKDHPHLLKKNIFEYTSEERKTYEQHPIEGYRILREIANIPEEITSVALQHHENSAGLGFPQKLMRVNLHSYSVIIHCIDEFISCLYTQKDKNDYKKALDNLYEVQGKMLSQQVLKTLYILFQIEVPKKLQGLLLPDQTSRLN